MNQTELQQSLQRIASQFIGDAGQTAAKVADQSWPRTRRAAALRHVLLIQSSILDIVTSPLPETSLFDLIVFAKLAGDAFERHWIPSVFGEAGLLLQGAFVRLQRDAWVVAAELLSAQQQRQLRGLIETWQEKNPEEAGAADVRLLEIAGAAGREADARAEETRGLLSSMKSATQTADQALLFAERALFLMQRAPFLLRAHVRLGAQEVLDEIITDSSARVRAAARRWRPYAVAATFAGAAVVATLLWVTSRTGRGR